MRLQVVHSTRYDYSPAVETAQHMAYLEPPEKPGQRLISHTLQIHPMPARQHSRLDVHGNRRCFFSLQSPHHSLEILAHSVLETSAPAMPNSILGWAAARALFRYRAGQTVDPACEFSFASPYAPRDSAFAAYAQPSFPSEGGLLAGAMDLMQRMHADFTYESHSTQVNTPALQALAQRKGVCQDFAHIMVACLRSLGLSARYVSGYLLTQPAPGMPRLRGSDASHAWASVYVPDLPADRRWVDLDPTNCRAGSHAPGEDYVTLATGRDFGDVSPVRGVIHGGASHTLTVGVTVEPLPESGVGRHSPDTTFAT
jgi:transglutaminase-like putative cysteine protease